MRRATLRLSMMLLSACVASDPPARTSADAMCDGLDPLARAHARDLAESGDAPSIESGARLIGGFAAACHLEF